MTGPSVGLYRVALWVSVLAIAGLAFAPLDEPPLLSYDKGEHVLAFLVLTWLADGGYPGRERAAARFGLLLAFGLLIEVVQHFLPYRHFSWMDLVADGFGILAYPAVVGLLNRALRRRSALAHVGRYFASSKAGSTRSETSSASARRSE